MRMASPGRPPSRSRHTPSIMTAFDKAAVPRSATTACRARRSSPYGSITCPFPSVTKDLPQGHLVRNIAHRARTTTGQRDAPTPSQKHLFGTMRGIPTRSRHSHPTGDAQLAGCRRYRAEQEVPEVTELTFDVRRGHRVTGERMDR